MKRSFSLLKQIAGTKYESIFIENKLLELNTYPYFLKTDCGK